MSASPSTTYHFIAASEQFLTVEEPLEEVLRERVRNYGEVGKAIDFWLLKRPAFLNAPELSTLATTVPNPAAAVVSTDPKFIDFLKLRLEFVAKGSFQAPSSTIQDPLAQQTI
ncbi:MgPME-cyclase complex family protein [Synechococcus sp. 1G10]|uniref:MgPME-cyclase complex family protein n=1 Tax=Synechococcus sp. 1G10 TaxID=2025605 RepID=UPI000B9866F6|nr:MgPME-cyclase complex family protein [Synechococcus sp. 1G10]